MSLLPYHKGNKTKFTNLLFPLIQEYGIVDSVKLIVDRDTRRSKGFAFAEMPNVDEAQKAIEELNQAEYEGRQMVVKEAIPRR